MKPTIEYNTGLRFILKDNLRILQQKVYYYIEGEVYVPCEERKFTWIDVPMDTVNSEVDTRPKVFATGGAVFRHHKGNLYEFICRAKASSGGADIHVYRSKATGEIYYRPSEEFTEKFKQELQDAK